MQEELEAIILAINDFSNKNNCKVELEAFEVFTEDKEYSSIIYNAKAIKLDKIIAKAEMSNIKLYKGKEEYE